MPEVNVGTPNDMNEHLCKLGPYHSTRPGVWCPRPGSGGTQPPMITSLSSGEEGNNPPPPIAPTTMMVGEEDSGGTQPPVITSLSMGEEGNNPPPPISNPGDVCVAAACPEGYGFVAGCAFKGDCMGDHEADPKSCAANGGVWCKPVVVEGIS